jgi:hypothetical protein
MSLGRLRCPLSDASSPCCKTIDDAYKREIQSQHAKLTRTSTGAMSGHFAMIYGEGGTTCSDVRSEAVNGEAAEVYRQIHKEGEQTFDTLIWISKSSGLPLRQEQDADLGKGQKGHETLIFHYSN